MSRLLPLWVMLVAACAEPNEDNWPEQYAGAACDFERRCLAAVYYDRWDDHEQCLDRTIDDVDDLIDLLDALDCDFEEHKARECLGRLDASCREAGEDLDDLYDACDEVFDCD